MIDVGRIRSEIPQGRITRGGFLELGKLALGSALGAAFVSSCGRAGEPPPPTAPPSPTRPVTPEGTTRLTGELPGNYSEFIKRNNLEPSVYEQTEGPQERTRQAVDYLRHWRDGVKSDPEQLQKLPVLSQLGIGSDRDYPINIQQNWTLYDVVNKFITEIDADRSQIKFEEINDPEVVYRAGIQAEFEDGHWQRTGATIFLANGLMTRDWVYQEGDKTYYQGRTDAETASTLIHEYVHILQEEKMLEIANNDPLSQESKRIIEQMRRDFLREQSQRVANGVISQLASDQQDLASLISQVQFNELQPENLAFLFINALNTGNNSEHFPGTRRRDLWFPFNIQEQQKLYPNIVVQDHYTLFRDRVLGTKNALDPNWSVGWSGLR